ncbi:MAG: TrmH family RNA methyltransferase [Solirubrobacteraceae bacterium]
MPRDLVQRFQLARRDPQLAVLEGFHALKHAARFGAELGPIATTDPEGLAELAASLAPDVAATLARAEIVDPEVLGSLAPRAPRTGVMAIAARPTVDLAAVLADARPAPIVLLEDPRTMGNMGACVRVAAGAGAAAVLTTGTTDPWQPDAIRGAAGLHFALPVARLDRPLPPLGERPLLAIDPEGDDLDPARLPSRAILAFGTERHGLTDDLLAATDAHIRIPMEPGVSSLNLATSVAAVLYAWRLAAGPPGHD